MYKSEAEEVGQTVLGQVIFSVFYTGTPWPVPGLENTQVSGSTLHLDHRPLGDKSCILLTLNSQAITDSEEELNKFVDNKTVNKSHPIAEIDNIF